MDPHIRWLRRFVVARVIERLAVEVAVVALVIGGGTVWSGWPWPEVALAVAIGVVGFLMARLGLAVTTAPINHRYLLRWTDPTAHLHPVDGPGPGLSDLRDPTSGLSDGFRFVGRLERRGAWAAGEEASGEGNLEHPGLDLLRAEGGRVMLVRGDDGEVTVLSALDDGRALVTSIGLVPPTDGLLVQRCGAGGRTADDAVNDVVFDHVERLLELRSRGVEARATGPDDVVGLFRTEWEAWQAIGPIVGPLVAVGPGGSSSLALRVEVPDDLVRDRSGPVLRTGTPVPQH